MSDNKPFPVPVPIPRGQLVAFAVRFLNTPGVLGTSVNSQIDFLRKKGLTQHEISSALRSAKLVLPPSIERSDNKLWLALSYYLLPQSSVYSPISVIFGLSRLAISITLLLYISYRLITSPKLHAVLNRLYIRIRLILGFKPRSETASADQPTEGLSLDSLQELDICPRLENSDMADIIAADSQEIESISRELSDLQTRLDRDITELRSEIKSVRSLLLSSSQFPKPQTVPTQIAHDNDNSSLEFKASGLFHRRSMPATNNTATRDTIDTPSSSAMDFLNSLSESNPTEKPADPGEMDLTD